MNRVTRFCKLYNPNFRANFAERNKKKEKKELAAYEAEMKRREAVANK